MAGRKTREQQLRTLERKPDVPDARRTEAEMEQAPAEGAAHRPDDDARQSEFPISRRGMNQESKHNKHNNPPRGAPKH